MLVCAQCKRPHPKVSREDRDVLLLKHRDLVFRTARKAHRSLPPSIELDDVVSYGIFGLIRAIEHFDPASGVHFETYAVSAIRGVIADELRSQDWAPRSLRKKQRAIATASKELEREFGREPLIEEIASKAEISVSEVELTRQAAANASHSSLDEKRSDTLSSYDQIPDPGDNDPSQVLANREVFVLVAQKITTIPLQDQMILMLYYHEMLSLREIGLVLGISESRASQLHVRAALEIREQLIELLSA